MRPAAVLSSLNLKSLAATLAIAFLISNCGSTPIVSAGSPQEEQSNEIEDGIAFFESKVKPILHNRCFECHGNDTDDLRGGLALISRKSILDGGDSGSAVDVTNPSASLLLDAINYGTYEMPPSGKLPADEIEILTKWVELRVPWTASDSEDSFESSPKSSIPQVNEKTKSFWSFKKVQRPVVPGVDNENWPASDIDRFVLSRLEKVDLKPAPVASKQTLIRRACYDLTGLPPTPEQVDDFVNDESEDAYSDLVNELLDSPHYGEKWGRHWLDLVRYAESNSFERDGTKPFVWRYRDYVIRSFNDDKPYDQFLIEQLAGDELENPTADSIIATGYYRLGQWDDEPADQEQALYDELDDILATTSQAMIGLTINCARCHDHKIDPIPTKDYYQMLAFFRNIRRYGARDHDSVLEASTRQMEHETPPAREIVEAFNEKVNLHSAAVNEIIDIVSRDLEPVEKEDFQYEENRERLIRKRLDSKAISQKQFDQYIRARNELRELNKNPPDLYRVLCVKEHNKEPAVTRIMVRGNPHVPADAVKPEFVSILSPPEPEFSLGKSGDSSGRRLALAKWIANNDHPLTARVMVNRIWQHHFGRGIVRSSSDFGFQGNPPSHSQLLDFLADEFVNNGWSIKQMHRLIMNSSVYKMSGRFDEFCYKADPLNDLFWRFDIRRLTAEEVRDSILAVSGRLNLEQMYGPSVFTPLSQEVLSGQSMPGAGWGKSSEQESRRRSIYIHVKRSLQVPLLSNFDSADTDSSCPVRFNTTQPTQALGMLNSDFTNREAEAFGKVVGDQQDKVSAQVREILERVTQRSPTEEEIVEGVGLIEQWQEHDGLDKQKALAFFCLTAFSLNEFIFVE